MSLTGTFTGVGVQPRVSSATAIDKKTVRVVFDDNMLNDTNLRNAAHYTITPPGGAVALTVSVATPDPSTTNPTFVDLAVDSSGGNGMTVNAAYSVTVDVSVQDASGNSLDPAHQTATFNGTGDVLKIAAVTASATDLGKLRVVFSKSVKMVNPSNTNDALHLANYSITGTSSVGVSSVTAVSATTVELAVSGQKVGGEYNLSVANVQDLANNVIT